jgi:hypothetical protein
VSGYTVAGGLLEIDSTTFGCILVYYDTRIVDSFSCLLLALLVLKFFYYQSR